MTTNPPLELYFHPFSSYSQKALIALRELGLDHVPKLLEPGTEANDEWGELWPLKRMPILVHGDRTILEATCVVEYLDLLPEVPDDRRLLPADPREALDHRMMDRFFDQYVSTPQQAVVFDALRPAEHRDPYGVGKAREMLDKAYEWLEQRLRARATEWACGERFGLADCGAAPFVFYAHWTHPIPVRHEALHAYRHRLQARPSVKAVIDAARPYRDYFPLVVPDIAKDQ